MIAPIDFIKEKYIQPNNITQDKLCDALGIGKKTISELYQHKRSFTIHTAKKFAKFFNIKAEFILMKQLEYDLAHDTKNYGHIIPLQEVLEDDKRLSIAQWILATVNNSISDAKMHYKLDDIYSIFNDMDTSKKFHYAILTIFKEVDHNDVIKYCELFNINKENLKQIYIFYKNEFNSEEIKQYEWLFKEL
jgi:addiction module HigA family antidote